MADAANIVGNLKESVAKFQIPFWAWYIVLALLAMTLVILFFYTLKTYNGRVYKFKLVKSGTTFYPVFVGVEWVNYEQRKQDQMYMFKLLKGRKTIEGFEPQSHGGRMFGGSTWFVIIDQHGFWHPFPPNVDSLRQVYEMKAIPQEVLHTQIQILERLALRYDTRSWVEKYGVFVLNLTLIVLLFISLLYVWDSAKKIHNVSADLLKEAIRVRGGNVGGSSIPAVPAFAPLFAFALRRKVYPTEV